MSAADTPPARWATCSRLPRPPKPRVAPTHDRDLADRRAHAARSGGPPLSVAATAGFHRCGGLRCERRLRTDGERPSVVDSAGMTRRLRRLLRPKLPLPGPLYVCPVCRGDYVNPVEWSWADDGTRWVKLRCGACEHRRETAVAATSAALLEAAHARRMARIADELERERMCGWVESFAGALERDLIDAGDFD